MGNKNIDVVQVILGSGKIDINQQNIDSRTALFMASLLGRDAAVELLVSQDPGPISCTRDRYGATPLIVAARNGHVGVLSH
jgi:ankyrin repeat protein